mmetsp:Transcript_12960/g.32865  ORF Transcript_12960/g.32865 Transcript_12960/m.32865 type:complete len:268 (+) Transcript_12960:165-968(+)
MWFNERIRQNKSTTSYFPSPFIYPMQLLPQPLHFPNELGKYLIPVNSHQRIPHRVLQRRPERLLLLHPREKLIRLRHPEPALFQVAPHVAIVQIEVPRHQNLLQLMHRRRQKPDVLHPLLLHVAHDQLPKLHDMRQQKRRVHSKRRIRGPQLAIQRRRQLHQRNIPVPRPDRVLRSPVLDGERRAEDRDRGGALRKLVPRAVHVEEGVHEEVRADFGERLAFHVLGEAAVFFDLVAGGGEVRGAAEQRGVGAEVVGEDPAVADGVLP